MSEFEAENGDTEVIQVDNVNKLTNIIKFYKYF